MPVLQGPYGVLVTGIGGTGVITIGQILGMAAHLEGKGVTVLDQTGLAQKNGAVLSYVRFAPRPEDLHSPRIAAGGADAVVGCDLVVTIGGEALSKMRGGHTRAAVNSAVAPTAAFTHQPDWLFPQGDAERKVAEAVGGGNAWFTDASRLATALMGDAIATNMFMLGFAWQHGLVPVGEDAILRAIELNAVGVEANRRSFQWGRYAAHDPEAVERLATPSAVLPFAKPPSRTLDESIARRVEFLTEYQDAAYAARYRRLVERVRTAESDRGLGSRLSEAVARGYFKLMAYKDEYEVARLYTLPEYRQRLDASFEGDFKLRFHLAPPLLNKPDPATGIARKSEFGSWVLTAFKVLAKLKGLRGGPFDFFGRTEERLAERQLIVDYERTIEELLGRLDRANHATAVAIATIPEEIRGYGHVKLRHLKAAKAKEAELLATFRSPAPATARAA
jgi:indolepyruvate ferredoxin oxidoreductase